jgi:hypothetical protein
LEEVDAPDVAGRGTEHFQGCDAVALPPQVGADAVTDADAGNDQGSEPDQRQELAHAFEEAARTWRRAIAVAKFPACAWEAVAKPIYHGLRRDPFRQSQPILAGEEAARLDKAGAVESVERDDRDGA